MVVIARNSNVQRVRFYAAGHEGRKNDFISIPRNMIDKLDEVDGAVNAPWNRAVAFGAVASVAKQLLDNGVELLGLARVRVRGNDFEADDGNTIESNDLVVLEWEGSEAQKLMKAAKKAASKASKSTKPKG